MTDPTTSTRGILGPSGPRPFDLTRLPPADDLADYIERHWIVRWDLRPGTSFTQALLPHPCINVVSTLDRVGIYGIPLARSERRLEGAGMAVGTKFRPGAFSAFVRVPARQMLARSFDFCELFGAEGARLAALASGMAGHIPRVEAFFRSRLPPPDPRRRRLLAVVADMLREPSSTSVEEVAQRHGISQRTLQRLFRDYVGVGPKWVLKRYRVHEAAERIAAGEEWGAARLAAQLGYFDQSHFIRDFRAQVGCSPHRYAQLCAPGVSSDTALGRAA